MIIQQKQKKFNIIDQKLFSSLSNDFNPIHLDQNYLRRTIFNNLVVHGIHLLLWSINKVKFDEFPFRYINEVRSTFKKAIYVGDQIIFKYIKISNSQLEIHVFRKKVLMAKFILFFCKIEPKILNTKKDLITNSFRKKPKFMTKKSISNFKIELHNNSVKMDINNLFPSISSLLYGEQISSLLMCSYIVGMECPGLNSIFSSLKLRWDMLSNEKISFFTKSFDNRLPLVNIKILGTGINGEIVSIIRPKIINQPNLISLRKFVKPNDFINVRALVIGGSRGLGEVCAKLLILGGAKVFLTFNSGKEEIEKLANNLNINFCKYDILSEEKLELPWQPTHLLYFASPKVLPETKDRNLNALKDLYNKFYVIGLNKIFKLIDSKNKLNVLYPSTIFLDNPNQNFKIYSKAKLKGEKLCQQIMNSHKNIKIYFPRFESLKTDLTSSFFQKKMPNIAKYMCNVLKYWTNQNFN